MIQPHRLKIEPCRGPTQERGIRNGISPATCMPPQEARPGRDIAELRCKRGSAANNTPQRWVCAFTPSGRSIRPRTGCRSRTRADARASPTGRDENPCLAGPRRVVSCPAAPPASSGRAGAPRTAAAPSGTTRPWPCAPPNEVSERICCGEFRRRSSALPDEGTGCSTPPRPTRPGTRWWDRICLRAAPRAGAGRTHRVAPPPTGFSRACAPALAPDRSSLRGGDGAARTGRGPSSWRLGAGRTSPGHSVARRTEAMIVSSRMRCGFAPGERVDRQISNEIALVLANDFPWAAEETERCRRRRRSVYARWVQGRASCNDVDRILRVGLFSGRASHPPRASPNERRRCDSRPYPGWESAVAPSRPSLWSRPSSRSPWPRPRP